MATPIMSHHVYEGADYWASWGNKGWSAVRVLGVKRKFADVERINAKTNKTKSRNAQVRLDEMVKRDPKLKGADKPSNGPAEVFSQVRSNRESDAEATRQVEAVPEKPTRELIVAPVLTVEKFRQVYIKYRKDCGDSLKESESNWDLVEEW